MNKDRSDTRDLSDFQVPVASKVMMENAAHLATKVIKGTKVWKAKKGSQVRKEKSGLWECQEFRD